jgi:hypothetical protein
MLDEEFKEILIKIQKDVEYIKVKVDSHGNILYGNGQKGLKERVIRLEYFKAVCLFVLTPIITVILSAIGYGIINLLKNTNIGG